MTGSGSDRAALVAAMHRRGVRATARVLVAGTWVFGIWFWLIAIGIGAIIWFAMSRSGEVDLSAVSGPVQSVAFSLFVFGIIAPLTMIAVHVAAGGTRRSYADGLWTGGVVVGVTFGLASAVVTWAGWWIADRAGWSTDSMADQLFDDGSQLGIVLLVQALTCTVYLIAGMTVAMAFYRQKGWSPALLGWLLVALLPVAVAELSLQSGWFGHALARSVGVPELPVWAAAIGGLVAVALAAALLRAVLRDVAIRPVDFSSGLTTG